MTSRNILPYVQENTLSCMEAILKSQSLKRKNISFQFYLHTTTNYMCITVIILFANRYDMLPMFVSNKIHLSTFSLLSMP